jgi:hypothetical protein
MVILGTDAPQGSTNQKNQAPFATANYIRTWMDNIITCMESVTELFIQKNLNYLVK